MAEFYCYEGIRNGATFKVNATTATALANNPSAMIGKVVTVTGDYEVGYGASGDIPLGFVEQVEKENVNSTALVASVVWNQSREGIAGNVAAGKYAACDGNGGLVASDNATSAKVWGVANNACTVYISG